MEVWIDEAENRGREKDLEQGREEGKVEMVLEILREKQPLDFIARVS